VWSAWLGLFFRIGQVSCLIALIAVAIEWLRTAVKYSRAYREYEERHSKPSHSPLEANKFNCVSLQYARRLGEALDRVGQSVRGTPLQLGDDSRPHRTGWSRPSQAFAELFVRRIKNLILDFHRRTCGARPNENKISESLLRAKLNWNSAACSSTTGFHAGQRFASSHG
jgi:hypothetical protein